MFVWAVTDTKYLVPRCCQDLSERCLIAAFVDSSQPVFDDSLSHQTPFACERRVLLGVAFAQASDFLRSFELRIQPLPLLTQTIVAIAARRFYRSPDQSSPSLQVIVRKLEALRFC